MIFASLIYYIEVIAFGLINLLVMFLIARFIIFIFKIFNIIQFEQKQNNDLNPREKDDT